MAQQPKAFSILLEGLEEFTPSTYMEGVIPVPGHLITLFWLPLAHTHVVLRYIRHKHISK